MATTLTTIDVSKWQDPEKIDWDGLKKRGLKSIIIQLSHGSSYEPNAKEFIVKAKSLGLKVHGYHFYEGSLSEIAFSYQNAEKLGLDKGAYMFLDMEGSISGDWQTQFYSFRSAWLQAGFHVGLYISESPYKAKFDNTKLVQDNVYRWIADYSHEPANYDIWQYSSSNGTLDVSYDRSGKLEQDYQPHEVYPVKPDDSKGKGKQNFEPGPRNPMTPKDGSWVGWGVDSSGLGGGTTFGYSTDGKNFYAAIWPGGFVFRQNDADKMFDLMKAHITTLTTNSKVAWANVLDKPDVALKSDIPKMPDLSSYALKTDIPKAVDLTGYAKLADIPSVTGFIKQADLVDYAKKIDIPSLDGYAKTSDIPKSMTWNQITDKPSLALTSDIPSLDGYAKLTDIPSITGLVKEAELDDYAKKTDLPVIPDLTPYAKLTDLNKYALTTQIPTTMAWDSITNKPTLALKSDIPSLTGYAKLTDIPSVSGLVKETELADYAKKSDLPTMPDLSGYATISSLIDYVKKTDLPDFTLFAKKSDIPTIPTDLVHTSDLDRYAKKSDIPVEQDLSNYAKKDDLNKYVTNETYSQNKTSLENTIQNLRTSLSNQNQVQTITSGTLADLASTQGSYHYEIDFVPSDGPASDWGLLDVVVGEHYAKQVFTNTGATGDNLGNVYIRTRGYGSTSWSEWREITLWQ